MIAKLICHAETRQAAIEKMIRAIREFEVTGLETTLGFCNFVMHHEAFRSGDFNTRFVENYFTPSVLQTESITEEEKIAAALGVMLTSKTVSHPTAKNNGSVTSKWRRSRL
jgi:propionyl-CoA carboxylase alpha chain